MDSLVLLSLSCVAQCNELCGYKPQADAKKLYLKALQNMTIYYGLNQHELELSLNDPRSAYHVYTAKNFAEHTAETMFRRNDRLDESDAVRHAAWALFSCIYIGPEKAQKFLNAHETSDESREEKSMDLDNNELGIQSCKKMHFPPKAPLDVDKAIAEINSLYKNGKLVILRPKNKK